MAAMYFTAVITNYFLNYLMLICSNRVLCELRKDMFNKMQALPIKFFDTHTHGELMSYYTNDIDAIREMLSGSITQLIISCTSIVGVVTMMLILSRKLLLIVIVLGSSSSIPSRSSARNPAETSAVSRRRSQRLTVISRK